MSHVEKRIGVPYKCLGLSTCISYMTNKCPKKKRLAFSLK